MKKRFLILATVVVGLGLTACSEAASELEETADDIEQGTDEATDNADAETPEKPETTSTIMYQCPDDCENGPAFFKEGPCKKCGKDMVEI